MMRKMALWVLFVASGFLAGAQLTPGFDKEEYTALMKITAQFGESGHASSMSPGKHYSRLYSSPEIGLANKWELWKNDKGTIIFSIRGTTKSNVSWLANFYAAMIPAKGSLQLSRDYKFDYQLSSHPRAAVHVGWTVSLGFLIREMKPMLDSAIKAGVKDVLIIGHSQGGAISYLLTAYLRQLQHNGGLPSDLRIKTYCSAAPKPGNIYFAYEYESLTQGGWAFNVVNAADWVPQTPFSVQGVDDLNAINPFVDAGSTIKKQSWPKRWALNYGHHKMKKPAKKALRIYQKYLGDFVAKSVKKNLEGFESPDYYPSNDYARTGVTIMLYPDEDYYEEYPQDKSRSFVNHGLQAYLNLTRKLGMDVSTAAAKSLNGSWELESLSGMGMNYDKLYEDRKPVLQLDTVSMKLTGSTGCNQISGHFKTEGSQLTFEDNMVMTKMYCEGQGEAVFLNVLKLVNGYELMGNRLLLSVDKVVVMGFQRK